MDKFNKIIHEAGLYDFRVIKEMGERHRKWHQMSWRERELLLLHIHLCILMCNKEIMPKKRKAPKENKSDINEPGPSKTRREETVEADIDMEQKEDSNGHPSTSGQLSSYESDWSREEDLLIELAGMESNKEYRFSMLNYMPLVEITTNHVAQEWGVETPTKTWDIIDRKTKKFIMIRYVGSRSKAEERYYQAKAEIPNNCCMYLIKWGKTEGEWVDIKDIRAKGEEKVKRFLLKRKIILESMGINTEFFKLEEGRIQDLFPSDWINSCVDTWMEDLLKDQFERWTMDELYVKESAPKTITAKKLLENLDDLSENSERKMKLFYRGKIVPEHFVQNIHIEEREDSSCVDRVANCIAEQLETIIEIRRENMHENSNLSSDILYDLLRAWNCSNKSTFNFINNMNCPGHKRIEAALGIGEKKKTYKDYSPDMKQLESKGIVKCKYPEWYEEMICGLEEKHDMYLTHIPLGDLIVTPPTDDHPIAVVVENAVSDMAEIILQSKAALMTSKITNLYSRLGGAYGHRVTETNKDKKNIAIFPIIAQMSSNEGENTIERVRLCSGLVVRAPSHARKPTDRIGVITIEMLKKTEITDRFCTELKGAVVYVCKDILIVMRQNSVMKEDSSYNLFVSNSMFIPINMLGSMTLENPNISQSENMVAYINDIMNRGQEWFLSRYIEGLCFALLGNSRDEGYFAHIRKLFMVIFTWRIGKSSASFDINSFCEKMNECLLDNPVSMHFHLTLLDILKIYELKQRKA